MRSTSARSANFLALLALAPALGLAQVDSSGASMRSQSRIWGTTRAHYIVQSRTSEAARESVMRVGGKPGQELAIINAVAADLNADQAGELRLMTNVHLFNDHRVAPLGGTPPAGGTLSQVLTDG